TFAQLPPPAPGGVTGETLWLKADAGVTTSGSDVSSWADQSTSSNHATQGIAANQPTLIANNINFNPGVNFDGANDNLPLNGTLLPTGTTARSVFVVAESDTGSKHFLGWGANSQAQAYSVVA